MNFSDGQSNSFEHNLQRSATIYFRRENTSETNWKLQVIGSEGYIKIKDLTDAIWVEIQGATENLTS